MDFGRLGAEEEKPANKTEKKKNREIEREAGDLCLIGKRTRECQEDGAFIVKSHCKIT